MKLLLTMNLPYFPAVGGANKANRSLAEEFVQRGHTVRVVVPALGTPSRLTHAQFLEALAAEGVQVTSVEGAAVFHLNGVEVHAVEEPLRLSAHLTDQLREFKPDWALVSSEDPSQRLLEIALQGCPERVAYLVHTPMFLPFGPQAFFPSPKRAKLFSQIRLMVAVSAFVQDYIREWSGLESTLVYMPVYGPGPFPALGCFENDFVTLVNPCASKGISIFEGLARALPEIQFAAVPTWGTTPADRARLERLPNVQLLEPQADFDRILARTRVTLVPSLWLENFSLTIVESMLRGIPVLGSRVGGIPESKLGTDFVLPVRPIERFTDQLDENYLPVPVLPEQDLQPWCEALTQLLSTPEVYEHHSRAARAAALQFASGLSLTPLEELLIRLSAETRSDPAAVLDQSGVAESTPEAESALGRAANLTPEQRALLTLRLRKKSSGAAQSESQPSRIPIAAREAEGLPLSFAQQRLWFLDQIHPQSPVYNLFEALRFTGALNVPALERSFSALVQRHETLRTTFPAVKGQPIQKIAPAQAVELRRVDLSYWPEAERDHQVEAFINVETHRPFDLAQGPLLRVQLLRLAGDEHLLLLVFHHIISDGWSTGILLRELAAFYDAFSAGASRSPLPDLPIQYVDYALWERDWLQTADNLEEQLTYWKRQLADEPLQLDLPLAQPRPPVQTFEGAIHPLQLSASVSQALRQLGRQEGATLFMTVLAAFQAFLHRYTGQTDIPIGTPVTGRTRAEVEGLIGFFVNMLVLRTQVSGDLSFRALVGRVREIALDAYAHQAAPFEKIVEALQLERDLSRSALFQVMFILDQASAPPAFSGLTTQPVALHNRTAKFDLTLTLIESDRGLKGELRYNLDLFESDTIARMATHFQNFLEGVITQPDAPLAALPLLTDAERQQMLGEWNATRVDYPAAKCLHELFEAQVERTPHAPALRYEGQTLSYHELNERANQLAQHLRGLGVGPGTLVALYLERSLEMVVGLVGILKAGGAYVPIDPAHPPARAAMILEDSQARVVLTQSSLLVAGDQLTTLCLDTDWETITNNQQPATNHQPPAPDSLAYVLYTSGSTGRPKGVQIPHRALVNFLCSVQREPGLTRADVLLSVTTVTFDIFGLELYLPLITGAQVEIASRETALDGARLRQQLLTSGATVMQATPATWRLLLDTVAESNAPDLDLSGLKILCGGEALPRALADRLLATGGEVWNLYGPTETTIWSSVQRLEAADPGPIVIGQPLANTQFYILDKRGQPVPIGVAGELHIGGDGLARGYLNRPDLTAERFIPNPFVGIQEKAQGARLKAQGEEALGLGPWVLGLGSLRLYRTGDLARYLPDGSIEFLGRLDHQVKVRGYRIELGEIEGVLGQHPAVRECVVVAREVPEREGQRLVAYVVPAEDRFARPTGDGQRTKDEGRKTNLEPWALDLGPSSLDLRPSSPVLSPTDLRSFLQKTLPEYMLPSAFVFLEALPLNSNGKVDRRQLPDPGAMRPDLEQAYVPPQTPIEEILAGVWSELLKIERVGRADDFFELGGYSLLATQVISRLRELFQIELPLRRLFESPVLSEFAGAVEDARQSDSEFQVAPLARARREGDLPLSFAQQRLWFLDQLEPGNSAYHMPSIFRLNGSMKVEALERSLNAVVERHESLRTTFSVRAGQPIQIIWPHLPLALPVTDLRSLAGEARAAEARRLGIEEIDRSFDLAHGPLIRARLVVLAQDEHLLILTLHHIISDGWSMGIFWRELSAFYNAGVQGEHVALPELPIQYADYTLWQRDHLQAAGLLEKRLAYWKSHLAGAPPQLELPTDHPRPPLQTFRGATQRLDLSPSLSQALLQLSRREGATLFMTVLAAFQAFLHRYTGQTDLVVGTPIAGQTRAEVEGLIGFFVNTLVLRTQVSGDLSFQALVGRVRETALEAYAHQEAPFEKIVEALHLERDLSRSPLFQVMFLLEKAWAPPAFSGLTAEPVPLGHQTVKFDLILALVEGEQGLSGELRYNRDLFDSATIARMAAHLQTFLAEAAAHPEQRLSELTLLSEAEQHQLLVEWNATQQDYPRQLCFPELFEKQVAQTPDAIAAIFAGPHGEQLTYRVLNDRANQLAHYLRMLGVGPEMRVGVCVERSLEMVIGLLGVLKAGGAYVPLDPNYPAERLAYMLEDSQATVLLIQSGLLKTPNFQIPNPKLLATICLDTHWPIISQSAISNPQSTISSVSPDNLAYLIYTSGSTGRPKGVLVPHRGLGNLASAQIRAFGVQADSRVLQFASFSFDASVSEVVMALLAGATLCLTPSESLLPGPELIGLLRDQAITTVTFPPSLLSALPEVDLPRLETIITAGEACSAEIAARWRQGRRFVNAYGPTEATVCATLAEEIKPGATPSIGRPMANTHVYVLDQQLHPVPIGVPGELYLGGIGLAHGYLNRPELTAEKFVPNPFAEIQAKGQGPRIKDQESWPLALGPWSLNLEPWALRLYRTGDLARYLPDGNIEFLGRIDHQVKVRGYRIELGEIEAALRRYPGVQAAVVLARADGTSSAKQLVAYLVTQKTSESLLKARVPAGAVNREDAVEERLETVTQASSPPALSDLRTFLTRRLPEYMLPAAFVFLDALPLTPNGKVDRKALPAPDRVRPELDKAYVAPRTPVETLLAELWQTVLGLERIGVEDDFFELGGDSIRAAILINQLQARLGQYIYVVALFDAPTITALAVYLTTHYPEAVARVTGDQLPEMNIPLAERVDATKAAQLRRVIPALAPQVGGSFQKNPSAIFVLSPPRSGSTLLRVMLAGHPQLFAPPELELLSFNTLAERSAALTGRYSFWLEGTLRALMEIHQCDAEEAKRIIAECESQQLTTPAFYGRLQSWLGEKQLVDKTPAYALDLEILKRAESDFEQTRYIHLLRHPYGMIHSFEEAKLDQVFFRYAHDFSPRQLAELIWLISQQNILEFLKQIPAERQYVLRFETLVKEPEPELEALCGFLGLPFEPEMARPYHAKDRKMTDGIHPLSKMLGDVKFHTHQTVDSNAAERWRQAYPEDFLGDETWRLAETLGYERPASPSRPVAPTSAENAAERLSHLTREQRALLMLRLRKDSAGLDESHSTLSPIPVVARTADLPLSFAQQRLWVLDQLEPGNPAYHMPKALRLTGTLNPEALERSFNALLQRHEILRTVFPAREGQPLQVILPELCLSLPVTNLSELSAPEREAEARRLGIEEILRPFDLAHGPLIRVQLLRLAEVEHILLVSLHHIIADGWSMGIFWRELSACYNAFSAGQSASLPELPLQYVDFAHWQRHYLQGQAFEKQLAYWKQQLAEAPAMLELPTAHPRPAVQTFRGGRESLTLSPKLSQALIGLSRREGVTLFMTLFAAFQALLARSSGQADVVVGTPVAGRTRAETEAVIGCFLNTLALRTDLRGAGNPTFREVLSQVREVALGAYAHQDLPFEQLLEELHPVRDLSRTPIFQVLFNMWRFDAQPINLTGLQVETLTLREDGEAKFDLTLYANELPDKIGFVLVYNADLFDTFQMAQLLDHLHALLEAVTGNPDVRLADLPFTPLSTQMSPALVAELVPSPAGSIDFTANEIEQTLPARFEAQVRSGPERLAVKTANYALSYAELNAAANHVARVILARRGDIEERTALLFDHDAPMVIGLLGALKAGKTYVPLDPAYPPERLTYMVQDAQASLILTDQDHLPLAATLAPSGVEILTLEEINQNDEGRMTKDGSPWSLVLGPGSFSPDRLAYLLYTSGSTGQPKGVMQNHRNVLHHIRAYTNNLHINSADRLTLFSSYSFDAAVMDIFGALLNGATLYPYPLKAAGVDGLADWLIAHDITIYHSTPTVFRYFVEILDKPTKDEGRTTNAIDPSSSVLGPSSSLFPNLRLLVLGGEEAQRRDAEAFQRHFGPACRLINGLGPTESTVSLQYVIDQTSRLERPSLPVGYPVDQTDVLLLTEVGEQAAVYGLGEITLRSPHLAVGYWNQPELTGERFIKDQGARSKGLRLYKTGDLGRWLPDGSLEFVGRRDFQVKVRGYRVEIGEIETRLLCLPGVKAAVVVAQTTPRGESQLVAYVVPMTGATLAADELRRKLAEQLPDYMVPVACLLLNELPLTPTGKVDRRALPKVEPGEGADAHRAPRNAVEDLLAGIYAELLGLEQVSVEDDFFLLGGHSLLATRVISRIRALFDVELPLRALFESPTIAGLAERVARAQTTEAGVVIPPLKPVSREGDLPLSFAQQRLWFLDQLEPGNPSYHLLSALRLIGSLDVEKLEWAFAQLIQRHESLRTVFPSVAGQPTQRINAAFKLSLPVMELPQLSEAEQTATIERLTREELHRPFNLAEGPLLRARLLRLSESEQVLLIVLHHILADGWSMGILIRELSEFYSGDQKSELLIQYVDYAVWQREWLQGEALEHQLNYWQQQLAGTPPILELPTDHPRPPIQSSRGARQALTLSPELTAGLKTLSRQTGATLFMTLLAAFQTLLARYSGQDDLVVGSPIANRRQAEVEGLIGCFVNILALRGDLSGNPTFRELLGRTREVALGAYAHQDLPFEQLVEALQLERNLSHNPLFQVMFVLQNAPRYAISLPGLTLHPIGIESGTAQFDLTLYLWENAEGMGGGIEYSTDLFEAATISRLAGHFQMLLEAVVAHPDLHLWDVPLLTEAERRQLFGEWNTVWAEYPRELCIHQLFEAQAERTPEATAIVFPSTTGDIKLSYRELNEKANQLAHYLRQLGVGPESFVGLCLERSLEMAVGLLGILKAGGAYVPLDPAYPPERLAFMLADARIEVLVTQSHLLESLSGTGDLGLGAGNPLTSICLDTDSPTIAQSAISNLQSTISSLSPAYVIYTSGSTGTPKGVVIPHRALVNHSHAIREHYELQPSDRVLQFASISFDVAAEEFYPSWLSGAAVVLRPEQLGSFEEFRQFVAQEKLTVLNLPTPYWQEWVVESLQTGAALPESLRLVIIGNEKALPERLVSWQVLTDGRIRLKNAYGPTEATITTTLYDPPDSAPLATTVPIGRPIPNVAVYLLDSNLQPVPIGVPGELYIGGEGLARGYLGRPELTAEKFVPNPFVMTDDERRRTKDGGDDIRLSSRAAVLRLYKTGDLARYLPDGNIEFLGRVDQQVKVRGFRIELGEIETALEQHPAVRQVVVVVHEDAPGDVYLAAYLVPDQLPAASSELRESLKTRLPDYMIPSAFIWLEALPLLPNGKLDRRALPAPASRSVLLETSTEFVAPRTPVEEVLAGIWSEVLRRERVGIHDNFFDLGGHSLLATQVVSRVRQAFQAELPLRTLFESPTVAGLAQSIETSLREGAGLIAPPLRPVARAGGAPLPLSFAQQRLWFLDQFEPESSVYNIPVAYRLTGPLQVSALEHAFNALLERHEILRTTFAVEADLPMQVIAPVEWRSLPLMDLSSLPADEQEVEAQRWMKAEAHQPFSLTCGPLIRLVLLRLEAEDYAFLITVHHIISDGWSLDIFWRELITCYEAFANDQPVTLPELSVQYADFAAWQRNWLQGEVLETQLAYWKRQLADAPPILELPTDRPRPATQTFHGARQPVVLSPAASEALKALSRREGVTLFMTLLAAFQTLLARHTRQADIVVGTPVAGRNQSEIEALIGFFVNTLVLRTDLSGNPTFRELLQRVREVALEAYAHQDVPFEKLVEELQPERKLSHSPLFQALFVLQNESAMDWEFSNLTLSPWGVKRETVMFDLTLDLSVTPEGLRGQFGYNTDLFEASTIARLAEHFQILLEGIAAQPDERLAELPLLTATEQQQLLVDWNSTQVAYPQVQCLHKLFEAQAERTPEAAAIVYEDQHYTYRELNARANQLAYYLQGLGVGAEVTVGLYLERSLDFIVALLGVLKAGGVYVPLETTYPEDRLAYMLVDARIEVLITQSQLWTKAGGRRPAASDEEPRAICLDTEWSAISQSPIRNPQLPVSPFNLAYLIYTSGSTGQPKGVAVEHRQIFNYLQSILERLALPPGASYATVSTFAADLGNTVVFPSLVTGGCLHIISHERAADPEAFADYCSRHPIDCLKIVPSHLAALLNASHPEQVLPRRRLVLGGEASRSEWVAHLQTLAPACTILNHYGPTETTIGVLTHEVRPDSLSAAPAILPLGRPLNNTQIYILDAHLQPVPLGVPGELYLGGEGLTRGYLGRPELTAERFVPNPFAEIQAKGQGQRTKDQDSLSLSLEPWALRLYRTGDLARYLPDGSIEFLGRVDHQVKIRGFRIELPEIEAQLRQHPEVQEAVVLKREDTPGDPRLVAYVVPVPERVPAVNGRRRYRLPNNLGVVQLNKNETDYIYREIFELQAYLRHGITLREGDCIFDVGANIGLFTLFTHQMCRAPRVYAFEPNPTVAQILRANAALHAPGTQVFECGVSSENKTAEFTFFSGFSLLSGFYADAATEKQVVKNFMQNQQQQGVADMQELVEQADELLEERFAVNAFTTQLKTLSTLIREQGIERIDLLKINVEKSEYDVLLGIEAEDWSKIAQIVLEVDLREHLDSIVNLLEGHGYELYVEQDVLLQNTQLCYIYAIRPSADRQLIREQALGEQVRPIPLLAEPFLTSVELRSFLGQHVPDYMVPSAFVMLEALPLNANGKLDRRALPSPDHYREGRQTTFIAPRTPVEEKVADIWRELLRVERISLHDNFFELGGHSLLATQAISRVRKAFQVELPVRSLFEAPTIAQLAERIMQTELEQADSEQLARMLAELGLVSE